MFCEALFSSLCIQRGNAVLGHGGGMGLGAAGRCDSMQLTVGTGKTWASCQGEVEPIARKGYMSKTSKTDSFDSNWQCGTQSDNPTKNKITYFSPLVLLSFSFQPVCNSLSSKWEDSQPSAPSISGVHLALGLIGVPVQTPHMVRPCAEDIHPQRPFILLSALPLTSLHTTLLQADLCWQGYPTCKLS